MADETNETPDVESGLLDPQLSLSDELLLDQDDLGEDQASNKKSSEEIPNIEDDDPELEAIRAKVKEMEEEQKKLLEMQGEVDKELQSSNQTVKSSGSGQSFPTAEEKQEIDSRSIYVGNVDYSATAEELGKHFEGCGPVNRVTIMCDKYSGQPKGFAYIEFTEKDGVDNSLKLNESLFKGRQLKVNPKRTNRPGLSATMRGRGRGRGRGMFYPRGGGGFFFPMFMPMRGRGRPMRRSRSNWFAPY